jgi:hypothetical protein
MTLAAYFVPADEYKARWNDAPTDHELVEDHSHCPDFWPECKARDGQRRE